MANKLDLVFKKAVNRQYTSEDKNWYEEFPGVPYKLKGSDIWVEPIPTVPPTVSDKKIEVFSPLNMTKDTTVGNNKSWVACEHQLSSGDAQSQRIGGFIAPRYGANYVAILQDASDTIVPLTSPCGWFFDYETGVLTFDNNPASYGFNADGFKVTCWRYIGLTADDMIKEDVTLGHLIINPTDKIL